MNSTTTEMALAVLAGAILELAGNVTVEEPGYGSDNYLSTGFVLSEDAELRAIAALLRVGATP